MNDLVAMAHRVSERHRGLELLVLYGSRARGDAHAGSDWDFGTLGDVDPLSLMADLARELGTDRIDLADLARAGGLVRYRAARDGRALFEARPGAFEELRIDAIAFWCDAQPVLDRAYDAVLEQLGP